MIQASSNISYKNYENKKYNTWKEIQKQSCNETQITAISNPIRKTKFLKIRLVNLVYIYAFT